MITIIPTVRVIPFIHLRTQMIPVSLLEQRHNVQMVRIHSHNQDAVPAHITAGLQAGYSSHILIGSTVLASRGV